MAKLIVSGAGGRMGRLLVSIIVRDKQHTLAGALEGPRVPASSARTRANWPASANSAFAVIDDYAALARPDTVTLDFTNAAASLEHLEVAAANGAAIVIGSTGFTQEMEARARQIARARTRTVIAPNMSVGVNVLMKIAAEVATILGNFDAEVLEIHHRHQGRRAQWHRACPRPRNRGGARSRFQVQRGFRPRGYHRCASARENRRSRAARRRRGRRPYRHFRWSGRASRTDPSRAEPRIARARRAARGGVARAASRRDFTRCATFSDSNPRPQSVTHGVRFAGVRRRLVAHPSSQRSIIRGTTRG